MPRFFFNVAGQHNVTDPHGLIFQDEVSALEWGRKIASGLTKGSGAREVIIVGNDGCEIARVSVPFET